MKRGIILLVLLLAIGLLAALAYLRDPPWLAHMESGFRGWETTRDGRRARWIGGHASFFVPADARAIVIPTRTTFDAPGDPRVRVTIAIDDRPADALILQDDRWQARTLTLPAPGSRRVRRVDVRVDRLRSGNRGAQLGEVTVLR